jgi:basic membrane protein A
MQLSPSTAPEGLAILQEYFKQMRMPRDTIRRLLIVAGTEYEDFLRENSDELEGNPLSDLLYLETSEPLPGKGSTICIPYYGAMYEAGAVSCAFSYNYKILLVAANPVMPAIQESVRGFTEGFNADYLPPDEDKELLTEWLSDEAGGGFSIDDDKAMDIVYDSGLFAVAPLVFPVCGGASGTFYRLGDLFGGYDYIGIDTTSISPNCPFSVDKHIDKAVDHCIGEWLSSGGIPKHQTLSFADGWTEVVLHPYTEMQKYLAGKYLPAELLRNIHEYAVRKEAGYE